MTEETSRVQFRLIDWAHLVRQVEGKEYSKPLPAYNFTGRTFEDNPNGGPYAEADE